MQFLFQPLTWGFLLIAVPILVHLINMLRHRKQKWAAMDFLLESHKRNRRWVMLKQWLLLASRILAMVLLVAMLAKWVSGAQWLSLLGGKTTHHYVLLDDSYSMAEVDQNQTAYARALGALNGLVRSIANRPGQHQVTLLRWSRAALALRSGEDVGRFDAAADLLGQSVPRDPARLLDRLNATQPSTLQLSPEQAIELVAPRVSENTDQNAEVYLLTDMRRNEFAEPEALRNQLRGLTQNSAGLHLIDCGSNTGSNLSIVSLDPEQEVWATGVPLMVRFQLRNRTNQPAKNVVVRLRAITYAQATAEPRVDQQFSGDALELPPVVIEQISAGETVTRQVQVIFGLPGNHVVEAAIADDALNIDNRRWCTIDIKQQQRVLLVDGDIEQSNAFYLEKVINPDARLSTGIGVNKVDASYVRDVAPETLAEFDAIALLDVPRLDPQAVSKLEDFCRAGGGIMILCGRNSNLKFLNEQLYRNGEGLFPGEVQRIKLNDSAAEDPQPQVTALPHPVLAPLLQLASSPFALVRIRQLLELRRQDAAAAGFASSGSSVGLGVEVVATGPGGVPLILDKSYGEGKVLTILTGLSAEWSNWAQDPTFVVLSLRSLGYLSSFRRPPTSDSTGTPLKMTVIGRSVLPEAELLIPARDEGLRIRLPRTAQISETDEVASLELGLDLQGMDRDMVDLVLRQGVFEAWMMTAQGERLVKNFAHNVPPAEGDLARVSPSEFERKLQGVPIKIRSASSVSGSALSSPNASHSTLLMALLAALLLAEQALAYSASYHSPTRVAAGRVSRNSAHDGSHRALGARR